MLLSDFRGKYLKRNGRRNLIIMTWDCSHELNGHCELLKKKCSPAEKGCVMYGKVRKIKLENAGKDLKSENNIKK